MNIDSKIFVAGHNGLAGSAIFKRLRHDGYTNIVVRSKKELDLRSQSDVDDFFNQEKPEYVFDAAAKVGGIYANSTFPANFIYDNITIQTNLIHSSYKFNAKKFLFLGSVCIYPKVTTLPIAERSLMTGVLEESNEMYAVAKISGVKMCQAYKKQYNFNAISLMPTNLYGPGDNYHKENSHVMAAMIRRFCEAKDNNSPSVTCWGDGTPTREFLYSDDLADTCMLAMQRYDDYETMNVSSGQEISIKEIATTIAKILNYEGEIIWDTTKPNGTIKRPMNIDKITELGWKPKTSLSEGLRNSIKDFRTNDNLKK